MHNSTKNGGKISTLVEREVGDLPSIETDLILFLFSFLLKSLLCYTFRNQSLYQLMSVSNSFFCFLSLFIIAPSLSFYCSSYGNKKFKYIFLYFVCTFCCCLMGNIHQRRLYARSIVETIIIIITIIIMWRKP